MKRIYFGKVNKGVLVVKDKQVFFEELKRLEGKEVEFTISVKTKKKTYNQLKYYWGVIVAIIAKETGNAPDVVHQYLKRTYLSKIINILDDGRMVQLDSIIKITTKQMSDYLDMIIVGEAEKGIILPYPNEVEL